MNLFARARRVLLLSIFMLVSATATMIHAETPTIVRFASVGGITDAPLYFAEEYGFFEKAGLKIEMQRMNSAPNLLTALATGQLDVAGISITPGLYSSVQQGVQIRIVGDKQSLSPGVSATRLVIRADLAKPTERENMQTLKGKTVAVSAKASSVYMLLAKLLKKYNMKLSDIHVVELAYPNMLPALISKAIDGAIDLEPFLSQAMQAGEAKVVSDLSEFVPTEGGTIVPVVYSEKFAQNTTLANAFMKAYMQGARVYNDTMVKGKEKDKAIEIIARYANITPQSVRNSFPAGIEPNQRLSLEFIDELQKFFIDQHFLRAPINVEKVVDFSFARTAEKELGTYK